jgi:hypothetical protein
LRDVEQAWDLKFPPQSHVIFGAGESNVSGSAVAKVEPARGGVDQFLSENGMYTFELDRSENQLADYVAGRPTGGGPDLPSTWNVAKAKNFLSGGGPVQYNLYSWFTIDLDGKDPIVYLARHS